VLDRPERSLFSLQEMELLGLFANQASIAVDLMQRARQAERVLASGDGDLAIVGQLAAAIDRLEGDRREAGIRLLRDLAQTLEEPPT
jgi:GAF domain-containing protein